MIALLSLISSTLATGLTSADLGAVCIKAFNDRFVSTSDNERDVRAFRDDCLEWETYALVDINGGFLESGDDVALLTHWETYWTATPEGELTATAPAISGLQTFKIFKNYGEGQISFGDRLSFRGSSGKYINSLLSEWGAPLFVNAETPSAWEEFKLEKREYRQCDGCTSLVVCLSAANQQFVDVDPTALEDHMEEERNHMFANSSKCNPSNTFVIMDLNGGDIESGDSVAIMTSLGTFWSAQLDDTLEANRLAIEDWEKFTVQNADGGSIGCGSSISLLGAHGKYVQVAAELADAPLLANANDATSQWAVLHLGSTEHDSPYGPFDREVCRRSDKCCPSGFAVYKFDGLCYQKETGNLWGNGDGSPSLVCNGNKNGWNYGVGPQDVKAWSSPAKDKGKGRGRSATESSSTTQPRFAATSVAQERTPVLQLVLLMVGAISMLAMMTVVVIVLRRQQPPEQSFELQV